LSGLKQKGETMKTKQTTVLTIIQLSRFEVIKENGKYGTSFTLFDEVREGDGLREDLVIRKDGFKTLEELKEFVFNLIEKRLE
jgi:hypothetical protein